MKQTYIAYFQSVMTIGKLVEAETPERAIELAEEKLADKSCVDHCYFDQTDFELSDVEEWKRYNKESFSFDFVPNDKIKGVVAARLQKNVEDLSEEDFKAFLKETIEKSIE